MPIYEYQCTCGAHLEALESMGAQRETCGELCTLQAPSAQTPQPHCGKVERLFSGTRIRGDGKEAKEATVDPVKRSKRPFVDCCDH